jgi:hypothetical protein
VAHAFLLTKLGLHTPILYYRTPPEFDTSNRISCFHFNSSTIPSSLPSRYHPVSPSYIVSKQPTSKRWIVSIFNLQANAGLYRFFHLRYWHRTSRSIRPLQNSIRATENRVHTVAVFVAKPVLSGNPVGHFIEATDKQTPDCIDFFTSVSGIGRPVPFDLFRIRYEPQKIASILLPSSLPSPYHPVTPSDTASKQPTSKRSVVSIFSPLFLASDGPFHSTFSEFDTSQRKLPPFCFCLRCRDSIEATDKQATSRCSLRTGIRRFHRND